MLGHALTIHETNSGAVIPLCACAWIGTGWFVEERAREQHDRHVREETAPAPVDLEARAAYVERVLPIVRRPGRFSTT